MSRPPLARGRVGRPLTRIANRPAAPGLSSCVLVGLCLLWGSVAGGCGQRRPQPGGVDAGGQCRTDRHCDDGLVCSGVERCIGGRCQPGEPLRCRVEGADACVRNLCLEPSGCVAVPVCEADPDAGVGPRRDGGDNTGDAGDAGGPVDAGPGAGLDAGFDAGAERELEADCARAFEGDLVLSTQARLTAIDGVDCILGSLTVTGADVHDLAPLAQLRYVRGDLVLQNLAQVHELVALSGLRAVGGSVRMLRVSGQAQMSLLPQLQWLGGDLELQALSEVVELRLGEQLQDVGGAIALSGMPALRALGTAQSPALARLTMAGPVRLELPGAASVRALPRVTRAGTVDVVVGEASLSHLLPALQTAMGVAISTTSDRFDGFDALLEVGTLTLQHAPAAARVEGLSSLQAIDTLQLFDVGLEGDLSDFAGVEVGQGLRIEGAPQLTTIAGPRFAAHLIEVALSRMPSLQRLDNLHGLETITGGLKLIETGLGTVPELSNLSRIGLDLAVRDNAALTSLAGLGGLLWGRSLYLRDNPALRELRWHDSLLFERRGQVLDNPALGACEVAWVAARVPAGSSVWPEVACSGTCQGRTCVPFADAGMGDLDAGL